MSTPGLILLSFVISIGKEPGWSKAAVTALLMCSVLMLLAFVLVEIKSMMTATIDLVSYTGKFSLPDR